MQPASSPASALPLAVPLLPDVRRKHPVRVRSVTLEEWVGTQPCQITFPRVLPRDAQPSMLPPPA
jgi:hypothetical protein